MTFIFVSDFLHRSPLRYLLIQYIGRVIEGSMELRRDLAAVVVTLVGPPVLHPSEAEDVEELVHQDAFMTRLVEIGEGFAQPCP